MADPQLLTTGIFEKGRRNGRIAGIVSLFSGAVVGGVVLRSPLSFAVALYIAAGVKVVMVLTCLVWPHVHKRSVAVV